MALNPNIVYRQSVILIRGYDAHYLRSSGYP